MQEIDNVLEIPLLGLLAGEISFSNLSNDYLSLPHPSHSDAIDKIYFSFLNFHDLSFQFILSLQDGTRGLAARKWI